MYAFKYSHIKNKVNPVENNLLIFIATLNERTLSKVQFLLIPAVYIRHEYFFAQALSKAYYRYSKGNKYSIQFAAENCWMGYFDAFYYQVPSNFYIEVIKDSNLLSIIFKCSEKIYEKAPILKRYFRLLTTKAVISQRKRMLSAIEKNTKERYLEFCAAFTNIKVRVPNYNIANYLEVSQENLSRVCKILMLS